MSNRLTADLGIGLLAKDDIKELLFEKLRYPKDKPASQLLGRGVINALYALANELAGGESSFILECAFQPEYADDEIRQLAKKAKLVQVYCHAPDHVILNRFNDRLADGSRHPGHDDKALVDLHELRDKITRYGALDVPYTIPVDLSDFSDEKYRALLAKLRSVI